MRAQLLLSGMQETIDSTAGAIGLVAAELGIDPASIAVTHDPNRWHPWRVVVQLGQVAGNSVAALTASTTARGGGMELQGAADSAIHCFRDLHRATTLH